MGFDIDDPEIVSLAEALAARDGVSVEEVVKLALLSFAQKEPSEIDWNS